MNKNKSTNTVACKTEKVIRFGYGSALAKGVTKYMINSCMINSATLMSRIITQRCNKLKVEIYGGVIKIKSKICNKNAGGQHNCVLYLIQYRL